MRTKANKQIVRFRTFLRTLLHEVAHHYDIAGLKLAETFHTHGFFKRESSLQRQLVVQAARRATKPEEEPAEETAGPQLDLFATKSPRSSGR
jgi:hypothetical protein